MAKPQRALCAEAVCNCEGRKPPLLGRLAMDLGALRTRRVESVQTPIGSAGFLQPWHTIEPRLRRLQLCYKRQQGRVLTIAAREMHTYRQAVSGPMQG